MNFIQESIDPETPTQHHISKIDFVNIFLHEKNSSI